MRVVSSEKPSRTRPALRSSSRPGAHECLPKTLGGTVSAQRYSAGLTTLGGCRSCDACS